VRGALLVDKPAGPTSHDVVAFTRRLLQTTRVGHTGTLDPLATGLLVMLVGPATRLSQFLVIDEKEYLADIRLGIATPTYDAASLDQAVQPRSFRLQAEDITRILPDFLGTFPQLPPPFSAKKVDGTRAYEKARKNEAVDLKPVEVTVRELEVIGTPALPGTPDAHQSLGEGGKVGPTGSLRLRIVCSAGFYVRSLAHDIGKVLGCGAHLEGLRRTRAGRFRVEDAATLDVLEAEGIGAAHRLVSMNELLADLPAVTLTAEGLPRARNGNTLGPRHLEGTQGVRPGFDPFRCRVLDASGEMMAVAEWRRDGLLHPLLVLR
jgi:tRNA pseudouridine55 synthase